jgi:nicotinate-nucleotide pyrophosphorylase (carboxylating)
MSPQTSDRLSTLIQLALEEDLKNRGDITTDAMGLSNRPVHARLVCKQAGVVAGLLFAQEVFIRVDESVIFDALISDGDAVQNGTVLATLTGPAGAILTGERTALNIVGRLSGIATVTDAYVQAIQPYNTLILDTRKTTPGWRILEKYAVRCGGGNNHRNGLYDMFLIKENHITAAGGLEQAVEKCEHYMRDTQITAPIEIEVRTLDELKTALRLPVDRIMLDNMTCEEMKQCVEEARGRIPLEASGNVSLETVAGIAETGVDMISVGALTHSAPIFDISLLLET